MKDTITLNTAAMKDFLDTVIKHSYELGIAFATKGCPFTKEEAIKRIQDKVWESIIKE